MRKNRFSAKPTKFRRLNDRTEKNENSIALTTNTHTIKTKLEFHKDIVIFSLFLLYSLLIKCVFAASLAVKTQMEF